MAQRLIGVDTEDQRLPQGVIDASIGTGPNDLAAGNTANSFIGAYTTATAPPASSVPPGYHYFDTVSNGPMWSNGTDWVGGGSPGVTIPATSATAGEPGSFTPATSIPTTFAQLVAWSPVASPPWTWTVGQYVVLLDGNHAHWDGSAWAEGNAFPIPLTVGFTATPSETFEPWVGLTSVTEISWRNSSNVEIGTGTTPSFTVPTDGVIHMVVEDESVVDFLNFGFDNAQDQGADSLPVSYNWPATSLTGVTTPMTDIPNLRYFMAANTQLTGNLDISGHPHLEYIECFGAYVNTCDLTGCDSLIRLCFETNDLTELDLTDVRLTLRDLRAADQGGATPCDITCTGDLTDLYHYCVQSNRGTDVSLAQMPVVHEWWVWDKEATTLPGGGLPVSPRLNSLSVDDNPFTATVVTDLLIRLGDLAWAITDESIATSNFNGGIGNENGLTSLATANPARALLQSRSWDLTDIFPTGDTTSNGVWPANTQDGLATGWSRVGSSDPVAVYDDKLTAAWSGYGRVIRATADGASAANPTFTVTADRTSFLGNFWGLFCRATSTGGNGAKVMINGANGSLIGIGLSEGAFTGNASVTTLAPIPGTWTAAGAHTLSMILSGNQITLAYDGTSCYRATPTPAGGTWGGYYFGFCGNTSYVSRSWTSFTGVT